MRTGSLVLGGLVAVAHSFPTVENFAKLAQRASEPSVDISDVARRFNEKRLLFDPMTKPIDVSGEHAFTPPDFDKGDQRGPCPGLNALANHGYLSHDGVVDILDVIAVTNKVYGVGIDFITVLAAMGVVGVGNPLSLKPSYSLGGPTPKDSNILDNLGGLLGTPMGLDGSHNWLEADASITRDDLFVTGNAWTMNMTLFKQYLNSNTGDALTIDDLGKRAAERLEECIANNPNCYYGPFTGSIARNAGCLLGGRLLANHSVEYPDGQMTKNVLKSFWAVYEEDGELTYKEGWEQIPENWYRRPVDYSLVDLNLDLVNWYLKYPILTNIGGNLGKVNTFTGLDLSNVTGGVLNAAKLLGGNNLICFAMEIVNTFAPNSLSSVFKTLEIPLQIIDKALVGPLLDLDCPAFKDMELGGTDLMAGLLKTYPGAKKAGFAL